VSYADACMETLDYSLQPVVEALRVGPLADTPVNYYSYKSLSYNMDKNNVSRPAVVVSYRNIPNGTGSRIAGPYYMITRVGAVIYVEAPISVSVEDSSTIDTYGGREYMLQPITRAVENWIRSNPALVVPDVVRYVDGDDSNAELFPYDTLDLRWDNPFRLSLRRDEYERFTYFLIIEYLEVQ